MPGEPLNKSAQLALATAYPRPRLGQREVKVLQTAEEYTPAVPGDWSVVPDAQDAALDSLAASVAPLVAQSATAPQVTVAVYDFATDGGAVSTIPLGVTLPAGAIIQNVSTEIVTAPTSTSSNGVLTLNVATEGNLVATGITCDGAATSVKSAGSTSFQRLAAQRTVNAVVTTNAVLSGRVRFYITWIPGSSATT